MYNAETQTMFLKSLHKVQRETIKLYYSAESTTASQPAPKEEPVAETVAEETPVSNSQFVPQ